MKLYLSTYLNFSNTLASLELTCGLPDGFSRSDVSLLSNFKSLTELRISGAPFGGIILSDILENCPKLKRLEWLKTLEWLPGHVHSIPRLPDSTAQLVYPSFTGNKCLEYLDMQDSFLGLPLVEYLTTCLPPTLKEMKLSVLNVNLIDWLERHIFSIVAAFAKRLNLMKRVKFKMTKSALVDDGGEVKSMVESDKMVMVYNFFFGGGGTQGKSRIDAL